LKDYQRLKIYIFMTPTRKSRIIIKPISSRLIDLPAPINISLWWNYGSLLGIFIFIQIRTGIILSIQYCPNRELAFISIIHITRNINIGWIINRIHANGASLLILLIYIHIARRIYYGSFHTKKVWITGVTMFILTIIRAFIGYVLPWGQISFWAATVITNIFSAIPYIGTIIVQWLWGGFAVSNPTLNRFFIIHFIIPIIIILITIIHLIFLHEIGSNNPLGINSNSNRISFHLYFSVKDIIGFRLYISLFIIIVLFFPNISKDPENFITANPLITPTHIQPEWYFLWLYAILRSIPNKLGGVIALISAIIIIYLPSTITTIKKKSSRFSYKKKLIFRILILSWSILRWIGKCPVEWPFIQIGQIFTILFFIFFIIIPTINKE